MLAISFLSNFLCLVITAGVGVLKIGSNGRAHEACWLTDGLGWPGWLGLVAQPGEVSSCTDGREYRHWTLLFLLFEAVEARSSCSHLSPLAAYRQISTLHISKKKTWTY